MGIDCHCQRRGINHPILLEQSLRNAMKLSSLGGAQGIMSENTTGSIRENYDRLADAYARRFVNELQSNPLDPELLHRFATEIRGHGYVSDMGCGLGHVARYLHAARATTQPG
jgi:hypothetical protein